MRELNGELCALLVGSAVAGVLLPGCGKDDNPGRVRMMGGAAGLPSPNDDPGMDDAKVPRMTTGAALAVKAYTVCENDDDCELNMECVELLGSKICSVTGCGEDPELCVEGETCVVSRTLAPAGVCAFTGADLFCARSCRDPLVCNLEPECSTRGCCGATVNGCPEQCAEMKAMECEIAPQCPVECCGEE